MANQIPKIISQEIKKKYLIKDNTFSFRTSDDDSDRFITEVGDSKQPNTFLPQLKLLEWVERDGITNECNFSVRLIDNEPDEPEIETEGNKIKYIKKKIEAHFYKIEKGFEFDIVLKEKPTSNIQMLEMRTKGLKFYYQPPLTEEITEEQKAKGWTATETDIKDEKGDVVCHRPENVVGSYAVYHESKAGDYSKMGLKNYRAGKAFHIFRPKIIDNAGTEVWGKLNITDNLLTVEIPQEFLDKAVYPIRHAAGLTLGYYNNGNPGESQLDTETYNIGNRFTSEATSGNVQNINLYIYRSENSSASIKGCLYDNDLNLMDYADITVPALNDDWISGDLTDQDVIDASTSYMLVSSIISDITGVNKIYYDSGSAGQTSIDNGQTYASMPEDPWTPNYQDDYAWKTSIYCTYTAAASGPANLKSANGIAKASVKSINGVAIASVKSLNGIT